MKRLLAILISLAMALSLLPMTLNAITADIVIQAGSGTAVIDGIKDEAYDTATPLDFVQKGKTNGGGEVLDEPIGHAWVINDDTNVYVFFSVIDSELDSTSANNYETDSVDVFWMNNNEKQQWRLYYENPGSADSGVDPAGYYSVVVNDEGYDVECYFPITDVLDNSLSRCAYRSTPAPAVSATTPATFSTTRKRTTLIREAPVSRNTTFGGLLPSPASTKLTV